MNHDSNVSSSTRDSTPSTNRWAIILAGGDGTRLRSLTRTIAGDERPKEFCSILGEETLVEQTRRRAALTVPPAQVMFALTRNHEDFYDSLRADVRAQQLVVQPKNVGTAAAILYSLLRISHLDPESMAVMVGNLTAFLKMIQQALPEFFRRFRSIELFLNTPDEAKVVSELYSQLPHVNFSQHVLGKRPPNLAVLAVSGLSWNDLGRPHRVLSTLAAIGNRRYTQSTATSSAVC